MIIQQRIPWYMTATAGVGAIGLITSVGTLAAAFQPVFGFWAWGAAVLLDMLTLALTVWAVQATRLGAPASAPRIATHVCVGVSVATQAVTAYQGLAGGSAGITSAALHTIPPLVLCMALELIARHYIAEQRPHTMPARVQETVRVQIARAATGLPVDLRKCANTVVEAARVDVIDVRRLAALVSDDELAQAPAMRALCMSVPGFDQAEQDVEQVEQGTEQRRAAVYALRDTGMTVRTIANTLHCSPSTVSTDLSARRVGFTAEVNQ